MFVPVVLLSLGSILSNSSEIRTVKSLEETKFCSLQTKQGNAGVFKSNPGQGHVLVFMSCFVI